MEKMNASAPSKKFDHLRCTPYARPSVYGGGPILIHNLDLPRGEQRELVVHRDRVYPAARRPPSARSA
jgi:hypothetical protein